MSADLALERAGFTVIHHNGGKHLVLKGHGLKVDYWPTASKFMVWGKVFRATPEQFLESVAAGKYSKRESQASRCNRCHSKIYWAESAKGRWFPLDADGGPHMAPCRRVQ